ncbi:putative zinc-finger of a C2HC-type/Double zinc ribbon [Trypanosoma cruzi]|nr:putative zinc-finger of a C2HC-type/Double zinc ribbon [Trypanosoma cruzi]
MLSASRRGPAFKPQLRVCYLCGQQFGSASIGIHIPQCYAKKVAQWEIADPVTRGKRPKHPDTVNWRGEGVSMDKLNDEQFHEFTANLVPCRNCGRKFLPDRLVVHLRSCKGDSKRGSTLKTSGKDDGSSFNGTLGSGPSSTRRSTQSALGSRSPRKSAGHSPSLMSGGRPQLPICYLCGQQFGSSSIAIHIPQCYGKKLAQWEAADVQTRGKPPKHPDTVNWKGEGTHMDEHNDAQFAEFVSNLEPCPNCGRKFLADRLVVHLRSCKPGSRAKPPPRSCSPSTTMPVSARKLDLGASRVSQNTGVVGSRVANGGNEDQGAAGGPVSEEDISTKDAGKLNPKLNRLKKGGKVNPEGRACPRCGVVEYDMSAKFCRDCGASLVAKNLFDPCVHCGEQIPEGSRFCGTCGAPINGAAASERKAGAENVNASTIRVVVCPACKAVCDADGNFCDNCGAALGDEEPATAAPSTTEVMFCKKCGESFEDQTARFCEECGEILEKITVSSKDQGPRGQVSTLPPEGVTSHAPLKETRALPALTAAGGTTVAAGIPSPKLREARNERKVTITNDAREVRNMPEGMKGPGAPTLPVLSKSNTARNIPEIPEEEEEGNDIGEKGECSNCGRTFALNVLSRHERVCTTQKKRRVFNMRAMRLSGTGADQVVKSGSSGASAAAVAPAPKRDWRAESEAFRRSMRDARQVDKVLKSGGNVKDLPPPTYSENSHYTPCPHCGRKFAPDVAERHIPRCATTINKPKPPPRRR